MKTSTIVLSVSLSMFFQTLGFAQLSQEKFGRLHKEINPESEKWKSVPWKLSIVEAQQQAARERKLLFIWAMDGHPLGCT